MELNVDIGEKIKTLRKSKKLNIADLAKKSELSSGLISQIERNMVTPSIASLYKIAKALDTSVGSLLEEEPSLDKNPIVKKGERKRLMASSNDAFYELLSPDLNNRKIEFLHITIKVGEQSYNELVAHEGEECGLVLKGRLMVKMKDTEYILEEGDSIYFDSTIPHRYVNVGDEECVSVWAMTPASF